VSARQGARLQASSIRAGRDPRAHRARRRSSPRHPYLVFTPLHRLKAIQRQGERTGGRGERAAVTAAREQARRGRRFARGADQGSGPDAGAGGAGVSSRVAWIRAAGRTREPVARAPPYACARSPPR
jgi:hypothetical protein